MTAPRNYCTTPEDFGHSDVGWVAAGFGVRARGEHASARVQHRWSRAIRSDLATSGFETSTLARALGVGSDELENWLSGHEAVPGWAVLGSCELLDLDAARFYDKEPVRRQEASSRTRQHGQFFTTANPFFHPAVMAWWQELGENPKVLEPFAGANSLVYMLEALGMNGAFTSYDIEPKDPRVKKRDTLSNFPKGFDAVVTNPPYLARHFAKRKKLSVEHVSWGEYTNLYQVALASCLANAKYVAAIVPESFVTSGLFRERLVAVISLTRTMFETTEAPTCLALFSPTGALDVAIWRGRTYVGGLLGLAKELRVPASADRIRFNEVSGQIGLRAIDGVQGASIAFVPASEIDKHAVNGSSRLVTRIAIDSLDDHVVDQVITVANRKLAEYREATQDVLLTAFKGLRADGRFRRRIDYETARRILGAAVDATKAL